MSKPESVWSSEAAQIWVDADACPKPVREILFRAARRTGLGLSLVSNHALTVPPDGNIRNVQVHQGFDVADDAIAGRVRPGDLVVTADIPLAAEVMARGATALSPRGEAFSRDTIRQRLNMRDFLDTMRASGIQSSGPPPLSDADRRRFANALDRWLARAAGRP
jgi:hypothetical protein